VRALLAVLVLAGGLQPRPIPGYGVSLDLPPSWVGGPPPASASAYGVRYLFRAPEVIGSFSANVNLVVMPLPAGLTLRQWLFSGASAAFQYAGTTTPATIGGLPGLHYLSTRALRFGTKPLLTDEYAVVRRQQVYLITYTALASSRARYLPIFAASASSIRFTG
jgi:hypothetical protein